MGTSLRPSQKARRRCRLLSFLLPRQFGGQEHNDMNLWMCAIRYHLLSHPEYGGGLSLANDLPKRKLYRWQFPRHPNALPLRHSLPKSQFHPSQTQQYLPHKLRPHGNSPRQRHNPHEHSRQTRPPRRRRPTRLRNHQQQEMAVRHAHCNTHAYLFAHLRRPGSSGGITAFLVPVATPEIEIESYEWTLNMPTDHATVSLNCNVQLLRQPPRVHGSRYGDLGPWWKWMQSTSAV